MLRFKPAKMLLRDIGLKGFADLLLKHGEQYAGEDKKLQLACWSKQGSSWQRFKKKLRRQQANHFLCLRHDPEHNVILGVQAKSNQPIDEMLLKSFMQHYFAG
jgi:hypothetical protein